MKKVPVYKRKGDVLVKVGEITEKEARFYVDDPDVESVEAIYIVDEEKEAEGEEKKIHEYP